MNDTKTCLTFIHSFVHDACHCIHNAVFYFPLLFQLQFLSMIQLRITFTLGECESAHHTIQKQHKQSFSMLYIYEGSKVRCFTVLDFCFSFIYLGPLLNSSHPL